MKSYNLLYVADYAVMSITVDGEDDWTEEQFTEVGDEMLAQYVTYPDLFHLDGITEVL